jgi:hypothetical protein
LTIMITKDGIDIHSKDEKTRVYTPRSKISFADEERTRRLLGFLKALSNIPDAMAIDIPKGEAPEALCMSSVTVKVYLCVNCKSSSINSPPSESPHVNTGCWAYGRADCAYH